MNTRMQKYDDIPDTNMSRTKRNQEIYKSTDMAELSRFKSNANVSVISDAPKEINIEKIKNYIESLEDGKEEKRRRLDIDIPEEKEEVVERKEIKNYDINSVLEKARENKEVDYEEERHRSINNTQYSILKSIKIEDEEDDEDEDSELNTKEKTIVDLIQDIQKNSKKEKDEEPEDLFKELMGDSEDTVVMAPITDDEINNNNMKETLADITTDLEKIKEPVNDQTQELLLEKERLKQKHMEEEKEEEKKDNDDTLSSISNTTNTSKIKTIDKSFYTNSMSFTKTDFEGFDDLEKNANSGAFTKVAIGVAILLLIATVFLILNFVLDWNII